MLKLGWLIVIFSLLLGGCSTRGVNNRFAGATEQRLVTQSLDMLVKALPDEDLQRLQGESVYLRAYFIEQPVYPEARMAAQSSLLTFAQQRIELELLERYACKMVANAEDATFQVHFFFNTIGTDQDSLGISTPQIYLPGIGATQIDLIALEMFHGVSEGYYYIVERQQAKAVRSKLQKARVRTDRLNLPFISLPVNTLD